MTGWLWDHPVAAIGMVVLSVLCAVGALVTAAWALMLLDDERSADGATEEG